MAHLSAHLLLCPAKGVRSFLATTPCPQLDLGGALQRTGEGLGESPREKPWMWAQRHQEGPGLKDGLPVYLLEAEPHRHLKSTDPLSFRSQRCPLPNMSLLPSLVTSREDSQNRFRVH